MTSHMPEKRSVRTDWSHFAIIGIVMPPRDPDDEDEDEDEDEEDERADEPPTVREPDED